MKTLHVIWLVASLVVAIIFFVEILQICEAGSKHRDIRKVLGKADKNGLAFVLIGDFGWVKNNIDHFIESPVQVVTKSMDKWASGRDVDLVVTSGDNFYPKINSSLDKDAFKSISFVVEQGNLKDLPFLLTYGNHDCYGPFEFGRELEVLYENVYMPSPPYNLTVKLGGFLADFSFLSCDLFCLGPLDEHMKRQCKMMGTTSKKNKKEYEWLENHFKSIQFDSRIIWKVVFTHFPIFSVSASSGDSEGQKLHLLPLLNKYGIDLVLSGHNHNMQHFMYKFNRENDYIVQDYDPMCLKVTHINCHSGLKLTCQTKNVTCPNKPITCEDRQIFNGFYKRLEYGPKVVVKQGDFMHQVIQGSGGGILDPLCNVSSPMANLTFALADYGFSEILISAEAIRIKYIHANTTKEVFETIIESNSFN